MWDKKEHLKHIPLTKVVIPGSHDSFTASLDIKKGFSGDAFGEAMREILTALNFNQRGGIGAIFRLWGTTQTLTITEQLNYGIRYFDFRMCGKTRTSRGVEGIHHCHGLYGNKADDTLKEIADFNKKYPNELLILHYSSFDDIDQKLNNQFAQSIYNRLGSKLVPHSTNLSTTTMGDLWDSGKNIIVVYENAPAREATGNSDFFWDEEGLMINGWTDSPDKLTLEKRVRITLDCRCNKFTDKPEKGPNNNKLFNFSISPTPNFGVIAQGLAPGGDGDLLTYSRNAQTYVMDGLRSVAKSYPLTFKNVNIISADDVKAMKLVEFALELNDKVDVFTPEATLRALTESNENGWHNKDVQMELTATKNKGPSKIWFLQYIKDKDDILSFKDVDKVEFTLRKEGVTHIKYRAADRRLNYSPFEEKTIKIDKTLPEIVLTPNGNETAQGPASFTVMVTDSGSGIDPATLRYRWTQDTNPPTDGWVSFVNGAELAKNQENGNWYLHIQATDQAGNTTIVNSD